MYDWSQFTKRITIKSPSQKIYEAWTTPNGLESWFLRKAEFTMANGTKRLGNNTVEPGDRYEWMWHGYGDDMVERNDVMEVNGKNLFRFHFAESCTVTVQLKEEAGTTIVELTQSNIPTDEETKVKYHLGCMEGWTFYLANLKSIMEGGIDLRNKDLTLKGMVNS